MNPLGAGSSFYCNLFVMEHLVEEFAFLSTCPSFLKSRYPQEGKRRICYERCGILFKCGWLGRWKTALTWL